METNVFYTGQSLSASGSNDHLISTHTQKIIYKNSFLNYKIEIKKQSAHFKCLFVVAGLVSSVR